MGARVEISWSVGEHHFLAREPTPDEVSVHAPALCAWYNEPHNRELMSNTTEMTIPEVSETYAQSAASGGRAFLLFLDGALVGDADLRHIQEGRAEFAIMIGPRTHQGLGLGTRFSIMVHAFAFQLLGVHTAFLSIVPQNVGGKRCYEKVGYQVDGSALARQYAEDESDVAMSLPWERFEQVHGVELGEICIGERRT